MKIDFVRLAEFIESPTKRFGDCFRRISDHPRYSQKASVYDFDVRFLTKVYSFRVSGHGGTFSSSTREWHFLDGGIISHDGYGWGSHNWTVVQGAEALRVVCLFFGIIQPLRIKGEGPRRPLSLLLDEMTDEATILPGVYRVVGRFIRDLDKSNDLKLGIGTRRTMSEAKKLAMTRGIGDLVEIENDDGVVVWNSRDEVRKRFGAKLVGKELT